MSKTTVGNPQRIVLCTYPSLYSDLILDKLLQMSEIKLVGVVLSTRQGYRRKPHAFAFLDHFRRSGRFYAGYLSVITQLYSVLRRLSGRPTMLQRLQQAGIPYFASHDVNANTCVAFLESLQPDWLLSAHFNQLISPKVLSLPTQCCLNIHPSLLPDLKGVDPAFFALQREYTTTGVTLHVQNAAFDEGEILAQRSLKIHENDSLISLNIRLFNAGADLLQGFFQASEIASLKTHAVEEVYDSWPSKQQVMALRTTRRLVDLTVFWQWVKKQ